MPKQFRIIHLITLLCLSVFALSTYSIASHKDGLLRVYFFDVGQGDAIFIESPSGSQVLIDGGPDNTVMQKLGMVMPFYDKTIDVVVMTHPDADHATGLISVLKTYDIGHIVYSDITSGSDLYDAWENIVSSEGAKIIDPIAGKIIDLGDGAFLTVLNPLTSLVGTEEKEKNDSSVVLVLKYGENEILLTGDVEIKGERHLMLGGLDINTDVIKAGHHGSKTSSSEEFLSAVSPDVAIIQVGAKNRYGHPSPEVISEFENYGIKYYRTDINGDIKLISDGKNYLISTQK
jgi:competence protein ComEC